MTCRYKVLVNVSILEDLDDMFIGVVIVLNYIVGFLCLGA